MTCNICDEMAERPGRLYIPFPNIYNQVGYIYHFIVYITIAVIYTKGYSGTDRDHTLTNGGSKNL